MRQNHNIIVGYLDTPLGAEPTVIKAHQPVTKLRFTEIHIHAITETVACSDWLGRLYRSLAEGGKMHLHTAEVKATIKDAQAHGYGK